MSIFKHFSEITDDKKRQEAIDTYEFIVNQENLTDFSEKAELRTDIVAYYNQTASIWADDYIY